MKKILIDAPLEYVAGHLCYGHLEGVIEVSEEELEKFKENPIDFLYNNEYIDELDLLIDDWRIDDRGPIDYVNQKDYGSFHITFTDTGSFFFDPFRFTIL